MKQTKKLKQEIEKWIEKNGCCNIDISEENIHLYNGGLFESMNKNFATLWIGDLTDAIRYLTRLKKFLDKKGFNTKRDAQSYLQEFHKKGKKKWLIKNEN